MNSTSAVVERNIQGIEKFVSLQEKQVQKVMPYIAPNKLEKYTEIVASERSKKVIQLEKLRKLKKAEQQQQEEFACQFQSDLLSSGVKSIEILSKASKKAMLSNDITLAQINQGWRESRNTAEREERTLMLSKCTPQPEFRATLMWMAEKGKEKELAILQTIKDDPHYSSLDIQKLIDLAVSKIQARLQNKRGKYQVFCSESEVENFPPEVQVLKSYPAYSIISAAQEAVAKIKEQSPVVPIETPKETKNSGNPMTRDQVVRFTPPVLPDWKQRLQATGAEILRPLGRAEIVVSVPHAEAVEQIKKLEGVAQVSPYIPKIRVQPQYLQNLGQKATKEDIAAARLSAAKTPPNSQNPNIPLPGILIANFFTEQDRDRAAQTLATEGIRIANSPGKTKLVLDVSSHDDATESLATITKQVGLQSLQEKTIPRLFNDVARYVIAQDVIPANPSPNPNNLSLTGKGEIIAVADTGLDTGDPDIIHPDFQRRVMMVQSYPITTGPEKYLLNFGADDGAADKYSGHGTHVAGSILGSGAQAQELGISSLPAGMATEAKLIFQAVEQTTQWTLEGIYFYLENYGTMPPPSELLGIPDDLQELFAFAYEKGARIHSNSWGESEAGSYDQKCEALDQFVWDHKDFLVVVAAGNDGKQSSSATPAIDQGSVTSLGTAKNCLTVGASENNRKGQFSDTYGQRIPDKFPYAPFDSDNMADLVDDIAAFSSRGPCQDGRRKPDVVAPGTFILSTRSSQIAIHNFADGAYPPARWHYMYKHGTSMATPLVAGCAALVRQYLREKQNISNPSAALVKASIIHSAQYLNYRYKHPSSAPWADNEQGWGRIDLCWVLNPTHPIKVLFFEQSQGLAAGEKRDYQIEVRDNTVPLRATLVYTDYPGEALVNEALVNNLNLILYSPSNQAYWGNDFEGKGEPDLVNNVEGVVVKSPKMGIWRIEVVNSTLIGEPQDYALVISGEIEQENN